jgi:hypothetical protein
MTSVRNERGMALLLVLLVSIAVTALAMGGIVLTGAGSLTSKFHYRELALQSSADGGIEVARDSLNRNSALLPDSGYVVIQNNASVTDASGAVIPGFTRSVYAGRTGGRTGGAATSGQYGSNFASSLSVIQDSRGAVAVRRMLFNEESWSRFAYAMNRWSNSGIVFGCGESAAGPVHSNQSIYLQGGCSGASRVQFAGPVTAVGSIGNPASGNFMAGYSTGVTPVSWPAASDLARLRTYAQDAGTDYDIDASASPVASFTPTTRLEFVTIDLNNNGVIEKDEGFFKVFRADSVPASPNDTVQAYVSARRWPSQPTGGATSATDPNMISKNCGAIFTLGAETRFWTASQVWASPLIGSTSAKRDSVRALLTRGTRRCWLGGDPHLFEPVSGDTLTPDSLATYDGVAGVGMRGKWLKRSGGTPVPAALATIRPLDQQYFFPLQSNANFKGVIYVRGPVAISGRLRGRVTLAATGKVVLADDLLYTISPGTDCSENGDMLGVTTPEVVPIEDNNVQSPFRVNNIAVGLYDDTPDNESYHMFIFTLKQFYGENSWSNPTTYDAGTAIVGERCVTTPIAKSGCVRVSGGIIQDDVGAPTYSNYSGWAENHTYDKCGSTTPPPYFPTTGRYLANRLYELDPVWLNQIGVAQYFRTLQSR